MIHSENCVIAVKWKLFCNEIGLNDGRGVKGSHSLNNEWHEMEYSNQENHTVCFVGQYKQYICIMYKYGKKCVPLIQPLLGLNKFSVLHDFVNICSVFHLRDLIDRLDESESIKRIKKNEGKKQNVFN